LSFRYGIELIPEPGFVAWAHRTRKLICDQYGSWTAEMFMVHLTVAEFFQCPDAEVEPLMAGLSRLAQGSRKAAPGFNLVHKGVATFPNAAGAIFLDFNPSPRPVALHSLHRNVVAMLKGMPSVVPSLKYAEAVYWPHLTLMQSTSLPQPVFDEALAFARAVVQESPPPAATRAWRLILARFESAAADAVADGWDQGQWARDLRWSLLASYEL
jgi:2'-5' RNA ligase